MLVTAFGTEAHDGMAEAHAEKQAAVILEPRVGKHSRCSAALAVAGGKPRSRPPTSLYAPVVPRRLGVGRLNMLHTPDGLVDWVVVGILTEEVVRQRSHIEAVHLLAWPYARGVVGEEVLECRHGLDEVLLTGAYTHCECSNVFRRFRSVEVQEVRWERRR